jgi:hypothetical protein
VNPKIRVSALVALVAAAALAGCTTTAMTAVTGYETAAVKGVQAVNDNAIQVWKTAACATPLSAVLRNPDIIPGLKALCLPGGNASDPNTLLVEPVKPAK